MLIRNVLWLDVPMDQTLCVGGVECPGDAVEHVPRLGERQRATLSQILLEVRPIHETHGDEQSARLLAGLEDRNDIGVIDRSRRLGFPDEARPKGLVGRSLRRQDL